MKLSTMTSAPAKHGGARLGSGRKKQLADGQTVAVVLDAEDLRRLDQQAQAQNLSRSAALRELIRRHLPPIT